MAPSPKRLCACGCALHVTRKVELGHLNGQRSALLAANVLSQNHSLLRSRKQAFKAHQMSPARHAGKQELVGRPAPAHQAFLSRKASRPSSENENLLGETGEASLECDDFPMSEAGPSGFRRDSPSAASPRTVNLDDSLSMRHSPTPVTVTQDLPPRTSPMPFPDHLPPRSYPTPLLDDADGHDQYSLSTVRRSRRITERVERVGRSRWRTNHVHFLEREEREEDGDEVSITEENLNIEDEEDGMGCDHDEPDEPDEPGDEEEMPFAEPGQEGISVWDLLGEGFMKEVAGIG
jgi:hypothetical protein